MAPLPLAIAMRAGLALSPGAARRSKAKLAVLWLVGALALSPLALVLVVVLIWDALNVPSIPDTSRWRFSPDIGVPVAYQPMYLTVAHYYGVNPFLLASMHDQETSFSTNPAAKQGWNACKAAGPMQFGVVGVPPYNAPGGGCSAGGTWARYKDAFRPIDKFRPANYPLDRRTLPSCRHVAANTGCVYDDFDAIAGTAMKLKGDGADILLESDGTRRAVCAYIGTCGPGPDPPALEVCPTSANDGLGYLCAVWERAKHYEQVSERSAPLDVNAIDFNHTLTWPTAPQYRTIARGFGPSSSPFDGSSEFHKGLDIVVPLGQPVTAAKSGVVALICRNVRPCTGYGNFVCLEHEPELSTCYAHLSSFAPGLFLGGRVARGAVIGQSGSTGQSTGPHLHFEVRKGRYPDGEAVDPLPWLEGKVH